MPPARNERDEINNMELDLTFHKDEHDRRMISGPDELKILRIFLAEDIQSVNACEWLVNAINECSEGFEASFNATAIEVHNNVVTLEHSLLETRQTQVELKDFLRALEWWRAVLQSEEAGT